MLWNWRKWLFCFVILLVVSVVVVVSGVDQEEEEVGQVCHSFVTFIEVIERI